jgi:osmoprotectant transport system substrate-binding protein
MWIARRKKSRKMHTMTRTRLLAAPLALLLMVPLTACISTGVGQPGERSTALATGDDAITIASFDFPESRLLAEIYAQALEAKGFKVKRAFGLGPRELVEPALERGLVEFVPEYLGTVLRFVSGGAVEATSDQEAEHRTLEESLSARGITVLASAPAQDANAIVVSARTAAKYELKTISDLIPVSERLVFGGPPECPSRPLCLLGLQQTYGLDFKNFVGLDAGGPLTSAELASGLIDVGLLFTTDWQISAKGFVVLADDRELQPPENVTPVVSDEIVAGYGTRFTDAVDAVSARLTTEGLGELNGLVSRNAKTPEGAAADWLVAKGLVEG